MAYVKSVSVITLTLNSEKYLRKCIDSVAAAREELAAAGYSSEHLVIDGGSHDETQAIISQYDDLVYKSSPVRGLYATIDYATKLVQSEFVAYVHSDDYISRDFLLNAILAVRQSDSNRLNGCRLIPASDVMFVDAFGNHLWLRRQPMIIVMLQKHENLVLHPNCLYPASLERSHPYTPLFQEGSGEQRWLDWLHINKLLDNGSKFVRVHHSCYYFRIHSGSTTVRGFPRPSKGIFSSALRVIAKAYIFFHETRLLKRLYKYLGNSRHFSASNG